MLGEGRVSASRTRPDAPDRRSRPPSGPVRPLRLPSFERWRLDNGLEVRVAEAPEVPEVAIRLVVEAGASTDPPGQEGVAELTGRLLTEGAGERDTMEVARWLDRLGAVFRARVGYDVATLSLHALSETFDPALEFLATVSRRPRFAAEEVSRVRSERLDEIEREHDEPAIVAGRALIDGIYGAHRYGTPAAGLRETVSGLDRESVATFHSERYAARDAVLIVCGDVGADVVRDAVAERFGDWKAGDGRAPTPAPPERPVAAEGVTLVDRPGSPQAEIRVGGPGAPYRSPDHFPILVANAILGGLFNSRLNMNLREDKGWTYGARTAFRFRRAAGPFVVRTAVETGVTAPAFEEILGELRGLRDRPPSEEEMELARNALTLSLPLQFETNAQVARRVARVAVHDLPEDYWETFRDRVGAVTREQVVEVAERYFDPSRLARVAVTDGEASRESLEALGTVRLEAFGA